MVVRFQDWVCRTCRCTSFSDAQPVCLTHQRNMEPVNFMEQRRKNLSH